jgi:hypothetical protein
MSFDDPHKQRRFIELNQIGRPRPLTARIRGAIKCFSFLASAALIGQMVVAGLPVRVHPLQRQYVLPYAAVSEIEFRDLLDRKDFLFVASVSFFVTTPGSNFTITSDVTWTNANNKVEVIAAGGSGAFAQRSSTTAATGGGGGEYGATTNFNFAVPGTTTAVCRVGLGGAAVQGTIGAVGTGVGNAGGDSWFNGTTQAGATLGAIGGGAGQFGTSLPVGGVGGTGGVGTTHRAGGRGGSIITTNSLGASTGGGGAGGASAAGNTGTDTSTGGGTAGGQGNGSLGGTGGAGNSAGNGSVGNNGTEWDASHGSGGGGGGGWAALNSAILGGSGGLYGAGGAGCSNNGAGGNANTRATSGAGAIGIVVLTWPATPTFSRSPTMFAVF